MDTPRNLAAVLATLGDTWSPRTVAVVNDYDVRVVKAEGEFTRHTHQDTDEFFLVLDGQLTIRLDAGDVTLSRGEVYVVARGVRRQPVSVGGAQVLLLEPSVTVNTGDNPGDLTASRPHGTFSADAEGALAAVGHVRSCRGQGDHRMVDLERPVVVGSADIDPRHPHLSAAAHSELV